MPLLVLRERSRWDTTQSVCSTRSEQPAEQLPAGAGTAGGRVGRRARPAAAADAGTGRGGRGGRGDEAGRACPRFCLALLAAAASVWLGVVQFSSSARPSRAPAM